MINPSDYDRPLPDELRERLAKAWKDAFDESAPGIPLVSEEHTEPTITQPIEAK